MTLRASKLQVFKVWPGRDLNPGLSRDPLNIGRGLVGTGAAGAFAPADFFNGCNAPVLRGIVCTKDLKSKETLGNLWLLEDILHPSCRDPNEAPGY